MTSADCCAIIFFVDCGTKVDRSREIWGYSSAGRALEWHSRGQRFDPAYLHHNTKVRTFLVQKRVRPKNKTTAEVIVLCGSFLDRCKLSIPIFFAHDPDRKGSRYLLIVYAVPAIWSSIATVPVRTHFPAAPALLYLHFWSAFCGYLVFTANEIRNTFFMETCIFCYDICTAVTVVVPRVPNELSFHDCASCPSSANGYTST